MSNAVVMVATAVNGDGHREVLGIRVATSDVHAGLVEAIAANLPGAAWQRCRAHYAANLMSVCPKSMWPVVKATT